MRTAATLIISLVMALGAIGLAVAAPGGGQRLASAEIQGAGGAVSIANSRANQAVFSAHDMRPGEGVSGTLRIGNDGDVAGHFAVRPSTVNDIPGPNGGLLSERIELVLFDVTDVDDPVTVYAGHPADFDQVGLGKFEAGEARNYLFAATLPDEGPGDNLYQGSGLSLGFEWRAGAAGNATPTPTPTLTVTPAPTATPAPAPIATPTAPTATPTPTPTVVDYSTALGLPPAARCAKGGKLKFKVKAPAGTKVKSGTVAVNGRVKARVKSSKSVTLKKLKKTFKVTVTVRASNGRTYTGSRVFRACGK
jgi:hypothetical protein